MSDRNPLPISWLRTTAASLGRLPALPLLLLVILGYFGVLEAVATHGPLGSVQRVATSYLDRSQAKAIEAFAAARAINAGVSVLKSIEVSPLLARFAPLEVLEPVDDLAKQFSNVMAFSIAAILVQRLLLAVAHTWALGVALPIGCALSVAGMWCARWPELRFRLSSLGRGIIVLAIFGRFVIPIAGWVGDGLTERFLADDLREAVDTMNTASGGLEKFTSQAVWAVDRAAPSPPAPPATIVSPTQPIVTPPPGPDKPQQQTYLGQLSGLFSGAVQGATTMAQDATTAAQAAVTKGQSLLQDIGSWVPDSSTIPTIVNIMHGVPDQIVKAIEIFLVQTMLAPLVVGVLLYSALRSVIQPRPRDLSGYPLLRQSISDA